VPRPSTTGDSQSFPGAVSFADLVAEVDAAHRKKVKSLRWGDWKYRRSNYTLTYEPWNYEIDLEGIKRSSQILDWVFQIQTKTWATPQVLADLLEALRELLDPQANYCPSGMDRQTSAKEAVEGFFQNRGSGSGV
jgi:hypothetical protein